MKSSEIFLHVKNGNNDKYTGSLIYYSENPTPGVLVSCRLLTRSDQKCSREQIKSWAYFNKQFYLGNNKNVNNR